MENETSIQIICGSDISDELMKELNSDSENLPLSRSPYSGENFHHLEEFTDIVVYINTHQTEILVTGVLFPLLIQTITRLYDKIKSKKVPIEIEFKDSELEIEFKIQGSDSETTKEAITKLSEICKQKAYLKYTNDKKYITKISGKPKIRMTYNPQTKQYEPTDFEKQYLIDIQKQMDAMNPEGFSS